VKHPAAQIRWREVVSSNVQAVGWDRHSGMYVQFRDGAIYRYADVSRQRAVACSLAASVGQYVNQRVKPRFSCTKVAWGVEEVAA
jgi:hypothetical protein